MTTPTPAQIEAAAKAMEQCMFAPHELPLDDELHSKYLWTAETTLTAAAQVEGQAMPQLIATAERNRDNATIERLKMLNAELVAALEEIINHPVFVADQEYAMERAFLRCKDVARAALAKVKEEK